MAIRGKFRGGSGNMYPTANAGNNTRMALPPQPPKVTVSGNPPAVGSAGTGRPSISGAYDLTAFQNKVFYGETDELVKAAEGVKARKREAKERRIEENQTEANPTRKWSNG